MANPLAEKVVKGDPDAALQVAQAHDRFGGGIPVLWDMVEYHAGKGHAPSMAEIGKRLMKSHDDESYESGRVWLEKAAALNDPEGMYRLGLIYMGDSKRVSNKERKEAFYKDAAKMFAGAAQRQHPEAAFELGKLYEVGKGVPMDIKKALSCASVAMTLAGASKRFSFIDGLSCNAFIDHVGQFERKVRKSEAGRAAAQSLMSAFSDSSSIFQLTHAPATTTATAHDKLDFKN